MVAFSVWVTTARAEALRSVEVSAQLSPPLRSNLSSGSRRFDCHYSYRRDGPNFLQSRTFRGRPGSAAAGLYVYEYRIDLRRAEGILHIPCLDSLSVDFGPVVRTLDFDGNGRGDAVFVVTQGGLGTVGLASAEKSGNTITFYFRNGVCAGGRPNTGQSSFFFGLVSTHSPVPTMATILESSGRTYEVQVRAPRAKDPLQQEIPQGAPVDRPIPVPNPVPIPNRERASQASAAVVDHLTPRPCVDRGGTVTIYGSGFGHQQGSRVVELGGHGIGILLPVRSWSNTRITALVPDDPRIAFGQWYYIGLQSQDRHWISNISRTINICRQLE